MSAPAALAMAKLFWPETEETRATSEDVYQMEKGYLVKIETIVVYRCLDHINPLRCY